MPKNKEALIRYRVINRCLLENQYVSLKEMKRACERALDISPIGERTIEGDINAMRYDKGLGYNAPIVNDRNRGVYYYDDPNYSIDNIPLNEDELDSIVFASKLLEQYKGVEILSRFAGSVQKLVDAINVYRLNNENSYMDFIEFEKVDEVRGSEFLETIIDALKNKEVLNINYRTFESSQNTLHIVHPYLLKEYRNRWYLIGYHDKYKEIRTYGLDRFVDMEINRSIAFVDNGFDAQKYYENVIGISVLDAQPVEVHIAYTIRQAQYVITQPLHRSQELVSENQDRIVFKYFLVPNFEFFAQVLAWGEEVEVLKPGSLRNEILTQLRKMTAKY
jgi:predicted DNA-binding transcriptional regulator YafY